MRVAVADKPVKFDVRAEVIAVLPRGTGLWKLPARSHLVHHRLHVDELTLVDTDAAMTGTATNRAARGTATGGVR